jgi:hypothetical protein
MKDSKRASNFRIKKNTVVNMTFKGKRNFLGIIETTTTDTSATTSVITITHLI